MFRSKYGFTCPIYNISKLTAIWQVKGDLYKELDLTNVVTVQININHNIDTNQDPQRRHNRITTIELDLEK